MEYDIWMLLGGQWPILKQNRVVLNVKSNLVYEGPLLVYSVLLMAYFGSSNANAHVIGWYYRYYCGW
jgi:hypothetical protein